MKLLVISSFGKYLKSLLPYSWLLEKYWPQHPEVHVGCLEQPDEAQISRTGFVYHVLGRKEDYPISRWSDALIKFLNIVDEQIFMLTLDDMWIVSRVNDEVVRMAYDYMRQFQYVARLDLTGDRLNARDPLGNPPSKYGELGHVGLVWSDPNSQYHLSTMPALWRKEHLLRVLVGHETPWQLELQGTPRLARLRDEVIVLGTDAWPIHNTLAFRGGDTSALLLDEIAPSDVEQMRSEGLLQGLE